MEMNDQEIVFSKTVRAGKRIYYLDVKKNRKEEMFLCITESKKIMNTESAEQQFSFEKHKIFLYKEDFDKFLEAYLETISFIKDSEKPEANHQNNLSQKITQAVDDTGDLKINIDDFE